MCTEGSNTHTHWCLFLLSHHEISPLNKHLLVSFMLLIATTQTWWTLLNDHLQGHRTCKVFDIDISSQANELFNLLGISSDGSHVKGSLPSLVPLVDLVLLSRRGAAGDFLLYGGRLWGVTGSRVWTQAERKALNWCLKQKPVTGWDNYLHQCERHWIEQPQWNWFYWELERLC